jgi:lysozyme family protein
MSAGNFETFLSFVLVHEGGRVDDPRDPGGRTYKGVTQRVYSPYRVKKGLPKADVWNATNEEIAEIYRIQYWDRCRCDDLPDGVDYVVFDAAINSGCVQATKWLQRTLNVQNVDGSVGEATIGAVRDYTDYDALVAAICARRLAFMQELRTWPIYKNGWSHRVDEVKAIGQCYATGSVDDVVLPSYAKNAHRRAYISEAKQVPSTAITDGVVGCGGTLTATIAGAQTQLQPFVGTVPYVDHAVAILIGVGVVIAAAGIAYRLVLNLRTKRMRDALDLSPSYAPQPEHSVFEPEFSSVSAAST